jgi:hypothetical protein
MLMLDANESMSERKSAIARLAQKHHLIDLHVHKHGTQDEPATYNRGTKRIDLALGTPTIAAKMTAIGYEEFNAGPFSDHRSFVAAGERKFKHPWSPVLVTAKRTVSYWKLWLSEEATKIDLHDHRSKILRAVPSINAPPTIPTKAVTKAVIQQHLRKA